MDEQQNTQKNENTASEQTTQPAPEPVVSQPAATPEPASTETAAQTQPAPQGGLSPESLAAAQNEVGQTQEQPTSNKTSDAKPSKKSKKPQLVIVLAVVVFLALAGLATYAYLKSQDKPAETGNSQQTEVNEQPAEEQTQPATANDVKDAAEELDKTVNATNEADELPEDGLADEAGL